MLVRVNKNTGTRKTPVKYAALSAGTVSAVWYDEESTVSPKRRNRILLHTREKTAAPKSYDA